MRFVNIADVIDLCHKEDIGAVQIYKYHNRRTKFVVTFPGHVRMFCTRRQHYAPVLAYFKLSGYPVKVMTGESDVRKPRNVHAELVRSAANL